MKNIPILRKADFVNFIQGQDFSKAVLMTIALVLPIALGVYYNHLSIGIFVSLGAIFASPNDVYGSFKLKTTGILLATALAMLVTLFIGVLKVPLYLYLPILGVIIFVISYLAIYGFRASLISFTGLFAIVLNLSSLSDSDLSLTTRIVLIGVGGLWYILLCFIRHLIFPKGPVEFYLSESLNLTADYLEARAKLIDVKNDREKLLKELLEIQTKLTASHESLRELLIDSKRSAGKSLFRAKRMMIFIQLVDMLELAMANPVNYYKTDEIFKEKPDLLKDFQKVLFTMSNRLKYISENLSKSHKIKTGDELNSVMKNLRKVILAMENEQIGFNGDQLMFINYWKYQNTQIEKIRKIEWLLNDKNRLKTHFDTDDHRSFLTKQDYNFRVLIDNFNSKSTIFRHSVRLALVAMLGYGLGLFFNIENSYWILLTLIVIMRPNFGLTKTRFKERSIGTIIGGILAFIIIYFIRDKTAYAVLGVLCFVVGFSMVQKNYKAAAAFITLYVLFIYALLRENVFSFIQFRVLDTLIGAGLAFSANLLLWPSWEIKGIHKTLLDTIVANRKYLEEIAKLYNEKGEASKTYKLSRKKAFLAFSDLSSSFQRMKQEPKRKQKNKNQVYRLVMIHNSFIASLASLGTYIINNETTAASENFNKVIDQIQNNLLLSERMLKQYRDIKEVDISALNEKFEDFDESVIKKMNYPKKEEIQKAALQAQLEEAHLVIEQLRWLLSMSERIPRILEQFIVEKTT